MEETSAVTDGAEIVGAVGAGGFFLLLIVVVWQVAATWRARASIAREEQYKHLAQKYAQLLEDNVALQQRTVEEITETRRAVTSAAPGRRVEPARPDGGS
ncbi:hypothetical protein [Streptomyces sp. TR06-5]|uniref:hypothetical protein n=1 Tax=unclassified Streptomyces TaxID=2593676 RepID=UPI0039A25F05